MNATRRGFLGTLAAIFGIGVTEPKLLMDAVREPESPAPADPTIEAGDGHDRWNAMTRMSTGLEPVDVRRGMVVVRRADGCIVPAAGGDDPIIGVVRSVDADTGTAHIITSGAFDATAFYK